MFARIRHHPYSMPIDLPVERNYTLLFSTLTSTFPGATGLKYLTNHSDIFRAVRCDDTTLMEPEGGWHNKDFICIYPKDVARKLFEEEEEIAKKRATIDLIVLGLPYSCTDHGLREFLEEKFGELMFCEIKRDHNSRGSKGFGFVRFMNYPDQVRAIATKRLRLNDRWINIKVPLNRDGTYELPSKIFVGRLSTEASPRSLHHYFCKYGEILDIDVPQPGIAYITFLDPESAASVIKRKHIMNGKSIYVCLASNGKQYKMKWKEKFKNKFGQNVDGNTTLHSNDQINSISNFLFNQCAENRTSDNNDDLTTSADLQSTSSVGVNLKSVVTLLSSLLDRAVNVIQQDSSNELSGNRNTVKEESTEKVKKEATPGNKKMQNEGAEMGNHTQSLPSSSKWSAIPEAIEKESIYYRDIKKERLSPPPNENYRKRRRNFEDKFDPNQPQTDDFNSKRLRVPQDYGNFQGRPQGWSNDFQGRSVRGPTDDDPFGLNDPDIEFIPNDFPGQPDNFRGGPHYDRGRPPMGPAGDDSFRPNDPDVEFIHNGDHRQTFFQRRNDDFPRGPGNFRGGPNNNWGGRPPRGPTDDDRFGFNDPDIEFIPNNFQGPPNHLQEGPFNQGFNQSLIQPEPNDFAERSDYNQGGGPNNGPRRPPRGPTDDDPFGLNDLHFDEPYRNQPMGRGPEPDRRMFSR